MEVYLIRHTETSIGKGVIYGHSDVSLKKPYVEEFGNISKKLPDEKCVVYSSPLRRCRILSTYLCREKKNYQTVIYDDRLKEMNFGLWELQKWDDLDTSQVKEWMDDFVNKCTPGGESLEQLNNRVTDFIESVLRHENENVPIIIIAHAGVIRCILSYVKNIPVKDIFSLSIPYGSALNLSFCLT